MHRQECRTTRILQHVHITFTCSDKKNLKAETNLRSWTIGTKLPRRMGSQAVNERLQTTSQTAPSVAVDRVKVLHLTRHKIGHFGDVPQANLLPWYENIKPSTTKACIQQSKQMYYNMK